MLMLMSVSWPTNDVRCGLADLSRSKVGTRRTEGTEVAQDFMQDTKQAAVSSK